MSPLARLIGLASIGLALSRTAAAGPGSPDPSFGNRGIAAGFPGPAQGVAIQADGKIVAAGTDISIGQHAIAVARFETDGSLDPTFGTGGIVHTAVGPETIARAMALQPDGKILVAARTTPVGSYNFALVRYNTDGSLDASFDGDGRVITDLGYYDIPSALAVQPDGKIVVAGEHGGQIGVVRYAADGSLDASFGSGGIVRLDVDPLSVAGPTAVAIQLDGHVVLAGWRDASAGLDIALLRLLPNGSLDPTFAGDGTTTTSISAGDDLPSSLVIQPDGRIVVGGVAGRIAFGADGLSGLGQLVVLRYAPDGTLDTTFDGDGIATTAVGTVAGATAIARAPDGTIVVTGGTAGGDPDYETAIALVRYAADGSFDAGFGVVRTRIGSNANGIGVALAGDGKIVVAGQTGYGSFGTSVVVRYGSTGPVCWDRIVEGPEECDDGDFEDGDCCSSACQLDAPGAPCAADVDPCTTDVCDGAGACHHDPGNDGAPCDDGDVCTVDACLAGACVGDPTPTGTCKLPLASGRGLLLVKTDDDPGRSKLGWSWLKGEATPASMVVEQDYRLCLYDSSPRPQPLARVETAGSTCGSLPCWKTSGGQPIYIDPAGTHDGLRHIFFRPGDDGKARIQLLAAGDQLAPPLLPLTAPVTVQLHSDAGDCWSSTFSAAKRNEGNLFRAKPD